MSNQATVLEQRNLMEEVLIYMDSIFNGDMDKLTADTMEHIKKNRYAFGPLWNEIGERVLRILFREKLRYGRNNFSVVSSTVLNNHISSETAFKIQNGSGEGESMDPMGNHVTTEKPSSNSIYLEWYCVGKQWLQLGDMSKQDCLLLSQEYKDRAKANQQNGIIFEKIAGKLKDKQTVKDAITEDELKEILNGVKNQD